MRVCTKCGAEKAAVDFRWRDKKKKVLQSWCRECSKEHEKILWKSDAPYKNAHKQYCKDRKRRNSQYSWDYLSTHPCVDCNERDPVVLDFDHIDPESKNMTVSRMLTTGCSIEKIQSEIDLCQVRCANCHRRRTADQFRWHRNIDKRVA